MQRRIRLVVEERRMALAWPPADDLEADPDATVEIPLAAAGRVAGESS